MLVYLKHFLKFLLLKIKWRGTLSFGYTNEIGYRSEFEGMNKLYPNTYFNGYMGLGTYIAANSIIKGKIGRFTSIASNCNVIEGMHPYTYPYVSTSPAFISTEKQNGYTFVEKNKMDEFRYVCGKYPVIIGNDCWIGYGVSIIAGTKIGDGAVVLAKAVVTKDVPPYAVVAGVPAIIIKYRYKKEDINFLLKLGWWNKDVMWLKKHSELFLDIDLLKQNEILNVPPLF